MWDGEQTLRALPEFYAEDPRASNTPLAEGAGTARPTSLRAGVGQGAEPLGE